MNKQVALTLVLWALLLTSPCGFAVCGQLGSYDFPPETNTEFTSTTQFAIPNIDGLVTFAPGSSYANATLEEDTWNFEGLVVNGGLSLLPNTNGVRFSVSADNSEVIITHLDVLNMVPPAPGMLEYSVSGGGSQAFNLHYSRYGLINWTVCIDGQAKEKGDGWTLTADGWLNVTGATSEACIQWTQAAIIDFTTKATYSIPDLNGAINFACSGTYWGEPALSNDTWSFQNLSINGSKPGGSVMWNFAASVQNCNMTISAYNAGGLTGAANVASWLNYTVNGGGVQKVNLHYGYLEGDAVATEALNFSVTIDGTNRTLGDGWRGLADGWLEVTGAESEVNIYRSPAICNGIASVPMPSVKSSISALDSNGLTATPATNLGYSGVVYGLLAVGIVVVVVVCMLVLVKHNNHRPNSK